MNEVLKRSLGLILDTCYFMCLKSNKTPAQIKLLNEANVTGGMFYAIEVPIRFSTVYSLHMQLILYEAKLIKVSC